MDKQIPYGFASKYGVFVTQLEGADEDLLIHHENTPVTALMEAQRLLQRSCALKQISSSEFSSALSRHYEDRTANTAYASAERISDDLDLGDIARELAEPEDLLDSDDDAPIIRLLNALITESIKENASDIHIEPFETRLSIRFRIDGVLKEVLEPPRQVASLLTSRIKVMAELDIAEKRLPQDGRISLRVAGRPVDIRVSTLPSGYGERVVMRLLDKQAGRLDVGHLGMSDLHQNLMKGMIHKPHGIILVVGPTGSGKTTTLYAILSQLNDRRRNILTVEDPVEYELDGIGQTQVNARVDMSFARGLRAILRQDPDVVMVGEIRDAETAQIAVQASLTGHLVLSTLHTNSAVGAITRLRDMGVEPFLLSSTLLGVVSQRLVRVLCPKCKSPLEPTEQEAQWLQEETNDGQSIKTLYAANGCEHCLQLGYKGRSGVYEMLQVDHELARLIHDNASEAEMEDFVRQTYPSLRSDGWRKVLDAKTSVNEVLRVSREG